MDGILSLLKSTNGTSKEVDFNAFPSKTATNNSGGDRITSMVDQSTIGNVTHNSMNLDFLDSRTPFTAYSVCSTPFTGSSSVKPAASNFNFNADEHFGFAPYSVCGWFPTEAETYLTDFRTRNLVNFAFIYIPQTFTAQKLRHERPFLFLAIMAVTSKSSAKRLALGREIKQMIAKEFLADNEGSFDVLQGLLVLLAWSRHPFLT
jgi:hypothetical protein